MNILFCGLPGCGKTTVSKIIANHLRKSFIDVDALIESEFNNTYSCRHIYSQLGEEAFRALEKKHIDSLTSFHSCIISLGGGCFDLQDNLISIKRLGAVVYLKASPTLLFERKKDLVFLDSHDPKTSFFNLAKRRIPLYEEAATITVDTDSLSIDEIVQKILRLAPLF